jgi:hypothetical protein
MASELASSLTCLVRGVLHKIRLQHFYCCCGCGHISAHRASALPDLMSALACGHEMQGVLAGQADTTAAAIGGSGSNAGSSKGRSLLAAQHSYNQDQGQPIVLLADHIRLRQFVAAGVLSDVVSKQGCGRYLNTACRCHNNVCFTI